MTDLESPTQSAGVDPRLLWAMYSVASELSLPVVLRNIVESATTLVGARYGALGVIGPDGQLAEFVNTGLSETQIAAIGHLPEGRGILGRLIHVPEPLRLDDLTGHPDAAGFPPGHPPMHSFLGVPIRVRGAVFGNLYLCEKQGAPRFTAEDESLAVALAAAAAVAVENARLHERLQEFVVLEDRERIARDLHDRVIQQLFATGMSLQATERMVEDEPVARRIGQAVDDLDNTIREIRNTIFALQHPDVGLETRLIALVGEIDARLGTRTRVHCEGTLDAGLPPEIAEHVPAVVRELVTNASKHGGATIIDVLVRVGGSCTVRVSDNGRGIDDFTTALAAGGRGLVNLTNRAETLQGHLRKLAAADGSTVLEWSVPLP
jgi:signal transduction histidine kinase